MHSKGRQAHAGRSRRNEQVLMQTNSKTAYVRNPNDHQKNVIIQPVQGSIQAGGLDHVSDTVYNLYQQNLQQLTEYYKFQNVAEQYNRLLFENLVQPKFQHSLACLENTQNMLRNVSLGDRVEPSVPLFPDDSINQCVVCRWVNAQSKLAAAYRNPGFLREVEDVRQATSRGSEEFELVSYPNCKTEGLDMSYRQKQEVNSAVVGSGDKLDPKTKTKSQGKFSPIPQRPLIAGSPSGDIPLMYQSNIINQPSAYYVAPAQPAVSYYQSPIIKNVQTEMSEPKDFPAVYGHCLLIGQPAVTADNMITLLVNQFVKVDITADHSIRVAGLLNQIAIAINSNGTTCGLHHPSGSVFQESAVVNIDVGSRKAKISPRGVTFTSHKRSLVYIVDKSGCKTTTERYRKIDYDFTTDVFYHNIMTGEHARQRAIADVASYSHETMDGGEGDEIWQISGIRIRKKAWGDVIVTRSFGRYVISLSPSSGESKLVTPYVKVFVNDQSDKYFQVFSTDPSSGAERKITVSNNKFRVKNGSQQAGFDAKDQLVLL